MSKKKKNIMTDELIAKLLGVIAPGKVAPQHQVRDYQPGWNHLRAEEQRQQIANTKPHLFRQSSLKKLAENMPSNSPKNGLYYNAMKLSNLQSVDFSVDTAQIEHTNGINYTTNQENDDT